MTEQDKQRLEEQAQEYLNNLDEALSGDEIYFVRMAYIAAATAEHVRMAELLKEQIELVSTREAEQDVIAADTVRLMDQIEYQKKALKEDYDKITKLEFELKEERNKVIDECKREIQFIHDISINANYQFVCSLAIENLEKLKSQ